MSSWFELDTGMHCAAVSGNGAAEDVAWWRNSGWRVTHSEHKCPCHVLHLAMVSVPVQVKIHAKPGAGGDIALHRSFYRHIWRLEDPPCVLESIGHIETLLMRLEAFALAQLEAEEEREGRQQQEQDPPQKQTQVPHKGGQGQSKRTTGAQPRQASGKGSTATTPTNSDRAPPNTNTPAPAPVTSRRLRVLLLTLPPLGEQLAGRHLLRLNVDAFNEALHAMLRHHPAWVAPGGGGVLDVSLLDLNGACQEAVRRHFLGEGWEQQQQQDEAKQEAAKQAGAKQGEQQDGGQQGPPTVMEADGEADGTGAGALGSGAGKGAGVEGAGKGGLVGGRRRVPLAPPPNSAVRLALSILWCMVLRFVFRVSYDRMSDWCGSVVLTPDAVHLNERGARLVHELLAPHIRRLVGGEQGQGQEQGQGCVKGTGTPET